MHAEMYERMNLALDHALGKQEARELEQHLLECPSCGRAWEALSSVHQRLASAPQMAPPPDLGARVLRRAAAQERARQWRKKGLGLGAFVLGSAAAAGLTLALSSLTILTEPGLWPDLLQLALLLISLWSTGLVLVQTFARAFLGVTSSWQLLLLGSVALGLTLVWTRIVAGSPLNRLIHYTEE